MDLAEGSLPALLPVTTILPDPCLPAAPRRPARWIPAHSRTRPRPAFMSTGLDRKSTRLNCSHRCISYAVFCLKKKYVKLAEQQQRTGGEILQKCQVFRRAQRRIDDSKYSQRRAIYVGEKQEARHA